MTLILRSFLMPVFVLGWQSGHPALAEDAAVERHCFEAQAVVWTDPDVPLIDDLERNLDKLLEELRQLQKAPKAKDQPSPRQPVQSIDKDLRSLQRSLSGLVEELRRFQLAKMPHLETTPKAREKSAPRAKAEDQVNKELEDLQRSLKKLLDELRRHEQSPEAKDKSVPAPLNDATRIELRIVNGQLESHKVVNPNPNEKVRIIVNGKSVQTHPQDKPEKTMRPDDLERTLDRLLDELRRLQRDP